MKFTLTQLLIILLFYFIKQEAHHDILIHLFCSFSSKIFDNNCTIIYKINNLPKEIF